MDGHNRDMFTMLKIEKEGLEALKELKSLLTNVQKLRGITNLYGVLWTGSEADNIFKDEINQIIEDINRNFIRLDEVAQKNSYLSKIFDRVKHLEERLNRFNSNVFDLAISYFDEYNLFAKEIINFIIDIEESSYLLADEDRFHFWTEKITMNTLLSLMENLRKLRAVGIVIIHKRAKSLNDSFEIQHYLGIIEDFYQRLEMEFREYLSNVEDEEKKKEISQLYERLKKDIDYFVTLTRNELLNQEFIYIEPQYYFDQANDVVKSYDLIHNNMVELMEKNLDRRISQYSKLVWRDRAIWGAIASGLLGAVFYDIYNLI